MVVEMVQALALDEPCASGSIIRRDWAVSVINKMLRDLDSRQSAPHPASAGHQGATPLDPLAPLQEVLPGVSSGQMRRGLTAVTSVLAIVGALGWWVLTQQVPQPKASVTEVEVAPAALPVATFVAPAPAPPALASASEPLVPVVTPPGAPQPVLQAPPVTAAAPVAAKANPSPEPVPATPVLASRTPAKLVQAAPQAAAPVATPSTSTTSDPQVSPAATSTLAQPERPVVAAVTSPPRSSPRPASAQEVLAQAQSLWNLGEREGAMGLLGDALALSEKTGTGKAPVAVLLPLTRELARMQIATGQITQALDLLTRLESPLSGVADIWALRGNAAQRLGRHAESVIAYQSALKLQPDEPRWLLAVAVSLAAQGQLEAAAQWAEKARSVGGLRADVATYLRQLGVSIP